VKIGIDYTSAAFQGAGIGRLTRNVVCALADIDHTNEYRLLVRGRHPPFAAVPDKSCPNPVSGIRNPRFSEVQTWIDERWWTRIWHRLHLPVPVEWAIGAVDIFHSPDFTLPPVRSGTRTVVTVHDLSFLRVPTCFHPALLDYLNDNVPPAVRRADQIVADSENTKRDLIELLDVPGDRISVVYPGVEPRFRPISDEEQLQAVRRRYNLPPRFVLGLGTLQPRKNYVELIHAFAELNLPNLWLVIVGKAGWMYEDIEAAISRLDLARRVILLGYVDDTDLPALYNLADVFAFPSLYEGFGIPPLEAMACGVPVVMADNSALPETAGDAALLVDASDRHALACALSDALSNPRLRQELTHKGVERARHFTWEAAAQSLLATYRQLGAA